MPSSTVAAFHKSIGYGSILLLFNTLGPNFCTGYWKRTKVYWLDGNNLYFFSALQAHKNISLYRHSVWVKKTLYYSNINYLFTLSLRKSGELSPPGCARCVNLNGGGVKLWGFAERSKRVMKFYWQALFNAYQWLNIFKTLWFKIIIMNYNRDMTFGSFFKAHLTYSSTVQSVPYLESLWPCRSYYSRRLCHSEVGRTIWPCVKNDTTSWADMMDQ